MLRSKFAKAFILGVCVTVFSSTAAFAGTDANQTSAVQEQQKEDRGEQQAAGEIGAEIVKGDGMNSSEGQEPGTVSVKNTAQDGIMTITADGPDASVSSPVQTPQISDKMLKKQSEIDQYVFEQHKDEITRLGFTVTHTGPAEKYVEVGITPYSEENAEYLYEIFGRDMVKVVEGIQATIMEYQTNGAEGAEIYAANVVSAQDNVPVKAASDDKTSTAATTLIAAAAAVVLLGSTAVLSRRFRPAKR